MKLINTDFIIKYTDKELSQTEKLIFEESLMHDKSLRQELKLHEHLNSYMKRRFKLERKNPEKDLFYNEASQFAKEAISDYIVNQQAYSDIIGFINKKSSLENQEKETISDMQLNRIGIIARNWINEWKKESQNTNPGQKYLEIRSFVVKGMDINKNSKQKLLKIVSKKSKYRKRVQFFNNWYYSVASAAALFLISFGLWKVVDRPMDNDELFVSFYHPYNLVSDRSRNFNPDLPGIYKEASNYYINENYREAALIFKKALDSNIEQADIRFLYAISLVELENYEDAVLEFKMIISKYNSYNLESKWYLSLCYLKLNKIDEAQKLLLELSEKRSFYQKTAREIMDQLD